jgi:glycosyltransferase involved in cell wall biosynthesis
LTFLGIRELKKKLSAAFDISIVISSYNRENKILKTVHSLFASDLTGFKAIELIIIDDGSPQPVSKLVPAFGTTPGIISLRLLEQDNAGIGATRNRGFREASSPIVLFIDDDIILHKDSIRQLYQAMQQQGGPVIFGSYPFISHQSAALERFARHLFDYDSIRNTPSFREVEGITSGLLCVNKAKLGMPDNFYRDELSVPAAEEHELIARFHKKGIPIYHAQHITAIHNHHLELKWLVLQQYKYGLGTAEALSKYPDITGMERYTALKQTMEQEGGFRNTVKNFLSSGIGRKVLFFYTSVINSLFSTWNHNSLFGKLTSAYFRAGYKEGLRKFRKG